MSLNTAPAIDPMRAFFARVIPLGPGLGAGSYLNIHWKTDTGRKKPDGSPEYVFPGEACTTIEEACSWARWADKKNLDVYLCMSAQRLADVATGTNGGNRQRRKAIRRTDHAVGMKSLWLDVDVKKDAYTTVNEALAAVWNMCQQAKFPRWTLVVGSGNGLHFHWVLAEPLPPEEWAVLGRALSNLAHTFGVKHDPQCSVDRARLLRPPGTRNFKDASNPKPTSLSVRHILPNDYDVAMLRGLLSTYAAPAATPGVDPALPARAPLPSTDEFSAGVAESKAQPISLEKVVAACGVLGDIAARNGNGDPEPLWNLAVYAATFAGDTAGREWAHKFSSGDPRYSAAETDRKFDEKARARQADPQRFGWSTCASYALHKSSICAACPHNGKVSHPFALGRDDSDLPGNYHRHGGVIWQRKLDDKGEPQDVLAFRYGVRDGRLETSDTEGDVLVFTLLHVLGDERAVRLPVQAVSIGGRDFLGLLGRAGAALSKTTGDTARSFFVAWINRLRERAAAKTPLAPFGWIRQDGRLTGFAVAGQVMRQDGGEEATGGCDSVLVRAYTPHGTMADWQAAATFITAQKRLDLQAIIAGAFAGPLVQFTGQSGLLVSAFSPESGIGKSSAMKVAQAVWGHPVDAMQSLNDTANGVLHKIGLLRSVPMFWDELHTEHDTERFVNLAFALGQGKEKTRLTESIQQRAAGTWTTLLTCASNDSVLTSMERAAKGGVAGINRVFEFQVRKQASVSSVAMASQLIGRTHTNFGHAGRSYAGWLAREHPKLESMILRTSDGLAKLVQGTPDERFWLLTMACLLVGGAASRSLGLVDFDLPAMKTFLLDTFHVLRQERERAPVDMESPTVVVSVLHRYLNSLDGRHLLLTDHIHRGRGRPGKAGIKVLNRQINGLAGLEAQLAQEDGVLRLAVAPFSAWLDEHRYSRRTVMNTLRDRFGGRETIGHIGAGTPYTSGFNTFMLDIDLRDPQLSAFTDYGVASPAAVPA